MKTALPLLKLLSISLLIAIGCKNEAVKPDAPKNTAASISLEKSWNMSAASTANLPAKNSGTPAQRRMFDGWYGEKGRIGFAWHFFAGGTIVETRGQLYAEGKWSSDDGGKTFALLFPGDKNPETVAVKYLASDSLVVALNTEKSIKEYGFRNDGATYQNPGENPFHPANNLWRTKPAAPETDEQIRARVKNHLAHLALILEATQKHNLKVASFRASPSPVHQYNGGVSLDPAEGVSETWGAGFFDKNDAKKGYNMMETALKGGLGVKSEPNQNWATKNLALLRAWEKAI